jgi:hypothetical protein
MVQHVGLFIVVGSKNNVINNVFEGLQISVRRQKAV